MPAPSSSVAYADRTVTAYQVYARSAIADWSRMRRVSPLLRRFAAQLPRGARVLDYGCGIGTDLAWLAARGFQAEGIDGTRAFVREARRRAPGAHVLEARFETAALPAGAYDGVWCRAALIHVPRAEFARQLARLRQALVPGGWLGLTLAWGRGARYLERDWIPGRYLAGYTKAQAAHALAGWSIRHLAVVTNDGRSGRWIHLLAQRPV